VMHEHAGRRHGAPSMPHGLTVRRRLTGAALAVVLLPAVTFALSLDRQGINLPSDLLSYLLVVVAAALVGGVYPAIGSALVASVLVNYYFTPPLHKLTVANSENILALVAFAVVAVMVSAVVEVAARQTVQAARATAESETLALLAGSVLRGETAVTALLDRIRETFTLHFVALNERQNVNGREEWKVVAAVGTRTARSADDEMTVPVGDRFSLLATGRPLAATDLRILGAFAAQAATALEQRRLTEAANAAKPLEEADRMRTALLTAVSHDLRSPLASAKAAVTSLLGSDVTWTPQEHVELLATANESLNRLHHLVDNLLDMSRLQAGALSIFPQAVALYEIVPIALDSLGPAAGHVDISVPDTLPDVHADPAMLERVIANLAANALRYGATDKPLRISASTHAGMVELRVVDHGPGISEADRERIFAPFQRLGDTDNTTGVGLGLALSRGLMEAMGGTLAPDDTPGGGLTMVLMLRAVDRTPS
jgi:two-component system sensor histidine kinase KdpD